MLRAFVLACLGLCISTQSMAWDVELRTTNAQNEIWVANQQPLENVDVYLAWFDKDSAQGVDFSSWRLGDGQWQAGLHPLNAEPLSLGNLEAFALTELPQTCAAEHRCFLALVAVAHQQDVLKPEHWLASSLLPLTDAAAKDRMPGQTRFLSADASNLDSTTGTATPGTTEGVDDSTTDSSSETEKPDIFRYENQQLLYANGQAERLQLIDLHDPALPALIANFPLASTPQEIYRLGDYYVLMQSEWNGSEGTRITSLKLENGQFSVAGEMTLPGTFSESRRRNERIYALSSVYRCCLADESSQQISIDVVQLDALGNPGTVAQSSVNGYNAKLAIFPDHLVVEQGDVSNWPVRQVQVFDLTQDANPLALLGERSIPGIIPSEFHIDVKDGLLRLVYGPEDRSSGSTLGIYDLSTSTLEEVGRVDQIAPGESLFATRFVGNTAYVVTYQRTDPLWVIDLSNPQQPTILGELEVPGWSEKLFFQDGLLFALGYDDQLYGGDVFQGFARRVSMSLFDVRNPTQPTLLDRFTPLIGQASYSYSPALSDERALLLDWEQSFASLPLDSYQTVSGSHLQLVAFDGEKLSDQGLVDLDTSVLRSLEVQPNVLGVLGDQSFLTIQRNAGKPEVLAELELASNLTQVSYADNKIWAGAYGKNGLYRLYRYALTDAEHPEFRWNLAQSYQQLLIADQQALFFNLQPLAIQGVDLANESLWPAQVLETDSSNTSSTVSNSYTWRHTPFLDQGSLYFNEQTQTLMETEVLNPDGTESKPYQYYLTENSLQHWALSPQGSVKIGEYSIPGTAIATANGFIISKESSANGEVLHLLKLEGKRARLLRSLELGCYTQNNIRAEDGLYLSCNSGNLYYPAVADSSAGSTESSSTTPQTRVLRINADLQVSGEWTFAGGYRQLRAVNQGHLLLAPYSYYYGYYEDVLMAADMAIMPTSGEQTCEVWQLVDAKSSEKRHEFNCQGSSMAVDAHNVWSAKGFVGLERENW